MGDKWNILDNMKVSYSIQFFYEVIHTQITRLLQRDDIGTDPSHIHMWNG